MPAMRAMAGVAPTDRRHVMSQHPAPRQCDGSRPALRTGRVGLLALLLALSWPLSAQQALRGVAAHAASEAVGTQLRPPSQDAAPSASVQAASAGTGTGAPAPAAVEADVAAITMARERGVLFKVTPPVPAVLPVQVTEAGAASPVPDQPVSYLLGTIHFGTPEEQGIDYGQLEQLIDGSGTFINEVDIDSSWKSDYDGYRWLPEDAPLDAMIDAEGMARAQALLPAIRPQDLRRMKPWAVLALLEARGEHGGEATMDARLQRAAAAAGKRMLHLETLEQQLQALDCVPAHEHVQVLDERLRKSWVLRIESAEAMAFYRSRVLEAWLASIDRMDGLDGSAKAIEQRARLCLLEDRNARWIGPLETAFQDGASFVAVGAIHLVGPQGLIARLRGDGYRIEAVPF